MGTFYNLYLTVIEKFFTYGIIPTTRFVTFFVRLNIHFVRWNITSQRKQTKTNIMAFKLKDLVISKIILSKYLEYNVIFNYDKDVE